MRPIFVYKLVVATEHDSEELNAEEMQEAIRHELQHGNFIQVIDVEWQGTISTDKAEIVLEAKSNEGKAN